jgi:hypothetical protein
MMKFLITDVFNLFYFYGRKSEINTSFMEMIGKNVLWIRIYIRTRQMVFP